MRLFLLLLLPEGSGFLEGDEVFRGYRDDCWFATEHRPGFLPVVLAAAVGTAKLGLASEPSEDDGCVSVPLVRLLKMRTGTWSFGSVTGKYR